MPYRDDQAALAARRTELREELAELSRRAEALAEVVEKRDLLARELASVEAKLERARRTQLPLLARVDIASPCHARWEDMTGDERVRFCGACEKNVYNLSAMESAEAEKLLAEHGASACVRFYRRQDGTVLTADCPVGVRRKRVRRAVAAVAGAGAMAATAGVLFTPREPVAVMGAAAPPTIQTVEEPVPAPSATPTSAPTTPATTGTVHVPTRPLMGKPAMR